jgi:hypothetical protein
VPLSEHEQRLLEQIEQALYAEDPKFAHSWRTKNLRGMQRLRVVRAAVVFVVGLGLLLGGVITQGSGGVLGIGLGVGGFLLMVGGAWLALAARQRPVPAGPATSGGRRTRGPRPSLVARLEERWQRRQDNR